MSLAAQIGARSLGCRTPGASISKSHADTNNVVTAAPTDILPALKILNGRCYVTFAYDAARAIDLALKRAPLVCVAGSIFLAGAVRDGLKRRAILH